MTIYGVIGPRDFNNEEYSNYAYVADILHQHGEDMESLISGGAKGVEALTEQFADLANITVRIIRPMIYKHGHEVAFKVRNIEIVQACDKLIVFWDGVAPAIKDVLVYAMNNGRHVHLAPMI